MCYVKLSQTGDGDNDARANPPTENTGRANGTQANDDSSRAMTQSLKATLAEFRVGSTRERARQIATEYLAAPGGAGWPIGKVVSFEEMAMRPSRSDVFDTDRPCRIEECWIVYLEPTATLRRNTILLISKEDGKVVFLGSAEDEV